MKRKRFYVKVSKSFVRKGRIPMKKKEIPHSLRVAYENWHEEERFRSLLALLDEYPGTVGEVALFSSAVHAPLPLAEFKRRTEIQKERMKTLREHSLSAGINILASIGHHEEDLDDSLHGPYTFMTNRRGEVCRGSYCMNDERYLDEYIRPIYRVAAEAEPDFIWGDDDIRYGHLPIGNGCFCENCIARFNRDNGTSYTRETLLVALDRGDLSVRRAWLAHNSSTISRLFRVIGKTVREIDPKITLGFMTGERYFEGYAFREWAEALSDNGRYPIQWRPGGGAYEDFNYDGILEKAEQIGRQSAFLPDYVVSIQSEIENFPYQLLKKTPTSTALEAAWTMTSGCTGAAFNILPSETGEPLETVEPHLRAIEKMAPLYRLLGEKTAGLQPCGICTGWRPDSQLSVPAGSFDSAWGGMYSSAGEMFSFGLPECYRPEHACVTLLTGSFGTAWTDEELSSLLRGGVYADASALAFLNGRGFAEKTGFAVEKPYPVDARELYADVPLNAGIAGGKGIAGGIRNCRQAFHGGDSYGLSPTQKGSTALASLVDYHLRPMTDCCLGIYENADGGRFCVSGYYPYSWISDYYKTIQVKRLMVWLSKDTLPSYVFSYARIRNHTFVKDDSVVTALLNPTSQDLEDVRIAVRTRKRSAVWYAQDGTETKIRAEMLENGYYRFFTVKGLSAFTMGILEV